MHRRAQREAPRATTSPSRGGPCPPRFSFAYNPGVRVITTHLSADFDAFAAAVCAVRLDPEAQVLFPGSQEAAVRRFLAATRVPYPEVKLRQARRETLEHALVVDTRSPARLGEVWDLIVRDGCPITLIDHHVAEADGLGARELVSRPVGATCTIVAQLLAERELTPSPEEASLLLMGIYEDTGGLSYRETTATDMRVAASLLESGASLSWVRQWVMKALEPHQLALLNRLVEASERIEIGDIPVAVTLVEVDRYHEEAAYVVHRWVETFDIPVGAVMLVRPPHVNLILRSRVAGVDVGRIAQHFGGGGHATAASARVSDRMPIEIREELLQLLAEMVPPSTTALDIATTTIFTVDRDRSVEEAKQRLNQLRVNALPVRDPADGRLIGMVTRQILDRALVHELATRPVGTVMHPELPTVAAGANLHDLKQTFLERSHRFVIVTDGQRPAGIITRMDLLRRLFDGSSRSGSSLDHRMAGVRPVSQAIPRLLRDASAPWVRQLLETAKAVADTVGISVYLVGGMVRDLLLGRSNEDVDLVVEGNGIDFAHALAAYTGGRCTPHQPFLNAVVILPDGHRVDVASARTEFYRTPAALPEVETSLIRQDLYRRDFTINALAIDLSGTRFGQLVDFFGGRKDLQRGEIRALHSLSFIDDPTRAIRAVRYASRLGFAIAPDTRNLIETAVGEGVFQRLTGRRLRRELEQLLTEPHPTPSLEQLAELGLLTAMCALLRWHDSVRAFLLEVDGQLAWLRVEDVGRAPQTWLLYLGALALCGATGADEALAERLQLAGDQRRRLTGLTATIQMLRAAAVEPARSHRVRAVLEQPAEVVLLAMAGLELGPRRALADAFTTAIRTRLPVRGADLVAAGVVPGPWIGRALERARDAVVDGDVEPEHVLDLAVRAARGDPEYPA